ncbi:MAG: sialidase family protein [Kiritimatiellia bacterium]|jgi:sialidase-1
MQPDLIKKLATGLIYRNPQPHVRSVHAYFPSIAVLPGGQLLAAAALGEAFEAANLRTHLFRSLDQGATWQAEGCLSAETSGRVTSECSRLTPLPNGGLAAYMVRHDRSNHPDAGLTNPATLGFVPTELCLLRSADAGKTWTAPQIINPPLVGPSFEMCSPITALRDGRWLIPTHTWPDWDGNCPNGLKMIALVSHDQGRTWPEYWTVMSDPSGQVYFWESKIVELLDGRLLATAWVYDDQAKADRPNHYALSADGGKSWSVPASTGLQGQTLTPLVLDDGRILSVYRRMDRPGLWANISALRDGRWENESAMPLWGNYDGGKTVTTANMSHNFSVLKFGAPHLARLADGTVLVTFWCYEDNVSVIRWIKLTC